MAEVGLPAQMPAELVPAVKIWDLFMLYDELDILEARLTELDASPIYRHVITEATRDLRGRPKPLWYGDSRERFAPWADRIVHNVVTTLSPPEASPDPWTRDTAQRDAMMAGLAGAEPDDVILNGDADEIPRAPVCGLEPPPGGHALEQVLYLYAVDWQYPLLHRGTIAVRLKDVQSFAHMRNQRLWLPHVPSGGWHLSWLGPEQARRKVHVQCHLERPQAVLDAMADGTYYREGVHEDGTRLLPVNVDETWPRWVYERKCPENWFRPR